MYQWRRTYEYNKKGGDYVQVKLFATLYYIIRYTL